jgi:hypothetical protein
VPRFKAAPHLSKKFSVPGMHFNMKNDEIEFCNISRSGDGNELKFIVNDYLIEGKGYLKCDGVGSGGNIYKITPKGWAYIESLKLKNPESQIVFVAMRFREDLKQIYSQAIEPVIKHCGFKPKIMFQHNHVNKIDDEIIALIKKSRFIVADFTEQNQGAYYEAGYARGLGLPVISTCEKSELEGNKLHFDTRQYRTIPWERDKLSTFQKELKDCIEANIEIGNKKLEEMK